MKISFYFDSVTRQRATQFLLIAILSFHFFACFCQKAEAVAQELLQGFEANPDPSVSSFQPLLNDPTDTFSFGFLRVNSNQLALAVLHVPSAEPLWQANQTQLAEWSDRTRLFFNGSLVLSDPHLRVFWSTGTKGDRVGLLNTSNLQIQKLDDSDAASTTLWQSFNFPTNTLVVNQNFKSTMSLVSSNGRYSMRLGNNFLGLYVEFNGNSDQIYWRHGALQAKAEIVVEKGPIHARINPDGYLGMYQVGSTPVDVESFSSYHKNISGFLRLRLESDGNLKAYYWEGSTWVLDYQAITETCELPSPCGSYGVCRAGSGCSCLDNQTDYSSSGGNCGVSTSSGDLCHGAKADIRIVRRNGVDLPFKELIRHEMTSVLEECENLCASNCSCWGALYNNASRFCYILDYPIQTLLGVGDQSKMGYFKVREGAGKKKMNPGFWVLIAVLSGALFFLILAVVLGSYRIVMRRRKVGRMRMEEEDGVSPGPYKNLGSASFRSIEMCNAPR